MPFTSQAAADQVKELALLEAAGADLNVSDYDGRTAMHLAASEGNTQTVSWLLGRGCKVSCVDRFGGTPIDDAKREGHASVEALLSHASTTATSARWVDAAKAKVEESHGR